MKKLFCVSILLCSVAAYSQQIPAAYTKLETDFNNSEFEACIKAASEIEKLAVNRADTIGANSYYYLGESYNQLGHLDKALAFFEKEKSVRAQLQNVDALSYSNSLYNLMYVSLQAGKYSKAGQYADELVVVDKKVHDISGADYAATIYSVADIYIQLNRFDDAEKILKSTIKRQPANSIGVGTLYNRLGDLYTYIGQFSKAQEALETSLNILFDAAGENSAEYVSAAINLGSLYMSQGKFPDAEEIFEVALNQINPSEYAYTTVLNNQALVYQSLGQLDKSENIFQKIKILDSAAYGTSHPSYAITLSNLGQVLNAERKYKDAEVVIKAALDILKKNNEVNTSSYAIKLNNLARVYMESGQPEKAIPTLEQALAIHKKTVTENHPEYAVTLFNLGVANWKAGKPAIAIKHLKTSAAIRGKVLGKKHPKYAESIQKIAEFQWMQKQTAESKQSFGEVFENYYFQIDQTFPGLTEEEKSRFYYNNIKDGFEKFNSFAVANSKEDPALTGDMFNYQINTKGAIMYATEKVREAITNSQDSALTNLFEKWHNKKEQIARYYSQNQDSKSLDSMMMQADAMEKELTRKSATFASQFARKKYVWQDIQKVLKPGEAAIEVLRFKKYQPDASGNFLPDVTYAFLIITPQTVSPQLVVMEKGLDLESKFLKFYHNSIRYNLEDQYSFKNYFEPLADALKKNNITKFYFSPDGVYNQVNINTIQNPFSQKYLLDEYDITLVTNTKELLEPTKKNETVENPILIGFPKFNLTKGTPEAAATVAKATRSRGGITRGMRGLMRLMRGSEGITELPGTQKEINEISKLFAKQPTIYLEHQATEDVAKQVNNPAYLHIATHGYFLEDEESLAGGNNKQYVANPLLKAGLIMAGAENFLITGDPINDAGDDGILTAYEAMNLKLDNTRLVVLSACETGLGHVKNGEGVYGLQRALKLAGTQSIVMSLWSVDDDATQELMSTFYKELIATGDQHVSFRTAQQKIKDKYKTPFYWGAFVMVGI
jgi:CHAT domain-containing protein/tetratricopeptide (TPR) repeat protein